MYKFLYIKVFEVYNTGSFVEKEKIENIVQRHFKEISDEIMGELNIEFSNK